MKLVTSDQMRSLEAEAVTAGTTLDALMEAAGLAVAQEAWLSLGVVAGRRVLVLVGPGNNGGDGLVAARHLAEWDADVAVYLLKQRAADDPLMAPLRGSGVPVFVADDDAGYVALDDAIGHAELVIDALLGIGSRRQIEGALADILKRVEATKQRAVPPQIVAVDLPTGVDADSGKADPRAVHADITVTFGLAKVGLYMLPGSESAGRVQVVDIGLPKEAEHDVPLDLISTSWVRARLPERAKAGNKGTFGRVLVVAGSANYVGAARLAAAACYRAGAGLVTIGCNERVQSMIAPSLAEATYLLIDESDASGAVAAILAQLESHDVLLIGPGLGQSPFATQLVPEVLRALPSRLRGCVIDADALNVLAAQGGWNEHVRGRCVLTPHPGEMSRLRSTDVEAVQGDRLQVAMQAAAEWGQTVVLKGAHTIVATADGRGAISPHANPLLATAGTGDVLAGVVGGLIAQGNEPFEAASCGVYVHGLAAEHLGEELGDRGMLASDLLDAIPRAIRTIREGSVARSPMPFDLSSFQSMLPASGPLAGGQ